MKYLAAYLLSQVSGNANPSKKDIESILSAAGIATDASSLDKVLAELSGKDTNELIASGMTKLASVPSGGAAVSSGKAASAAAVEAVVEEEAEESDEDMGMGLFD